MVFVQDLYSRKGVERANAAKTQNAAKKSKAAETEEGSEEDIDREDL